MSLLSNSISIKAVILWALWNRYYANTQKKQKNTQEHFFSDRSSIFSTPHDDFGGKVRNALQSASTLDV